MHICVSRGKEFNSAAHHVVFSVRYCNCLIVFSLHDAKTLWFMLSQQVNHNCVMSNLATAYQFDYAFPFCPTQISSSTVVC